MNKKVIGFLLAIPALMGFGLTSCSDEATLAVNEPSQDKLVDVTVTASLADLTRASLTPDKNIIKFEWAIDDVITVVNAENGKYLGKLTVSKIQESDHRVCEFAGKAAIPAGKVNLNFFYLGTAGEATLGEGRVVNPYTVDFSTQDGTAKFAENDILISKGEYNNVQDGNLGMINFGRDFAYGRFILKYNGEVVDLNGKTVTIAANTGKLYNKATLNFQTASYSYEEGAIAVTPATNDFYVSFPATDAVNLKFVVNEFDGTKGQSLVADTYYTADEEGNPIIVEMRHSDGSDDKQDFKLVYKSNYVGGPDDAEFGWKAVSPYAYIVRTYQNAFDSKDEGLDLTREGYQFIGWAEQAEADENTKLYVAGDPYTVTYPDKTTGTLYAQWKVDYKATLKYDDKEEVKKPEGDEPKVDLPTLPDKGEEEFIGWKKEGGDDDDATKGPWEFTEDDPQVVLVPVYKTKTYTWNVTWKDGFDDSTLKKSPYTGENGLSIKEEYPNNPTHDGYIFNGWKPYTTTLDKNKLNVEIVAQWKVNYQLRFHQNLNGSSYFMTAYSGETTAKTYDFEVEGLDDTMKGSSADYELIGWTTDPEGKTTLIKVGETYTVEWANPIGNLYAQWKKVAKPTVTTPGYGHGEFN